MALHLLTGREHSRLELKNKLLAKNFPTEIVEQVVTYCTEQDWVNDTRYAAMFCRVKARKGLGPIRINGELRQKGIPEADIQLAMEQSEQDWFELAKTVYLKKFGESPVSDFKDRVKKQRYLQYRGFDSEQISYVLA